jgi:hypothetical protein
VVPKALKFDRLVAGQIPTGYAVLCVICFVFMPFSAGVLLPMVFQQTSLIKWISFKKDK